MASARFPRVRSYELMVIFHPEVEEEALGGLIEQVQTYITDADGTVTVLNRESPWGRRRLAYPIRHESRDLRDGIYALYYFDTESTRTAEIEREIKLNTRIIRYMLIQQSTPTMEPPVPAGPAAAPGGGAPTGGPAVASEVSPGTPPEATPTPVEPTVPASAGRPLAAEENLTAPTLDSSREPSLPSETLPPADESLVEVAAAAEGEPVPAAPATDLPVGEAPPRAADIAAAGESAAGGSDDDAATEAAPTA